MSIQLFRIQRDQGNEAHHPYAEELFAWLPELHTLPNGSLDSYTALAAQVNTFQPDLLLISGWTQPAYLRLAKALRKEGIPVICGGVDNQWLGTYRQWLGVLTAPIRLWPYFDALWVTGNRAAKLARRLGYQGQQLLTGFYACDYDRFAPIGHRRLAQMQRGAEWRRRFLFTGRLTASKGVADLLAAYAAYRAQTAEPWELWIAGSGPLEPLVQQTPHVRYLGFLQPNEYGAVLEQVGAFVLPSHVEPWGVVLQEALCAGLPVIGSRQCGSVDELIDEGRNGFTFAAGDTAELATLMLHLSAASSDCLAAMGSAGLLLAGRYQPTQWAQTLWAYAQGERVEQINA